MDEISTHLPPDMPQKPRRKRTTSFASTQSLQPLPYSRLMVESPRLRHRSSLASVRSHGGPEAAQIVAPVPRRHLIQTSESSHWLHTPAFSPVSTRAMSPRSAHVPPSAINLHRRPSLSSFPSHKHQPPLDGEEHRMDKVDKQKETGSMGRRWVRWMHRTGMKGWVVPSSVLASTLVKWCIALGSYSGQSTPPMFGDYEAQRHWMELTIHLPPKAWYTYDLQYWGLDYPPLTAYISWICGRIGTCINPVWFAFDESRGFESPASKAYMRATVLAFDAFVYVPSLVFFVAAWQKSRSKRTQNLALLTLLFQPALLLVDFGHFQYNSVMLGLTLFSINFFATGRDLLGAFCFVLSLGFKQMALYYAPAVGTYLLAKCIHLGGGKGFQLFIHLAFTTTLTFVFLFLPFLPPFSPPTAILDPITRIFPFNRGLFEDKVANFWCASNIVFKWKTWAPRPVLVKLSAGLTAAGFLPSVIGLIQSGIKARRKAQDGESTLTPMLPLFLYALLTSSMSFFLFSFQVHEKTILLPLLPMTLLLSDAPMDSSLYGWGTLLNNVGVFSMWPLLKRDGLGLQYITSLILWNGIIGYSPFRLKEPSFLRLLSILVYVACISLHILELILPPPPRYPDLFTVANVLISTPVFGITWLWSIKCGVEVGWAVVGLGGKEKETARERRPSIAASDKTDISVVSAHPAWLSQKSMRRDAGVRAMTLGAPNSQRGGSRTGSMGGVKVK